MNDFLKDTEAELPVRYAKGFDTPYWIDHFKKVNGWIYEIAKEIEGDVLSVGAGNDDDKQGGLYSKYFIKCSSYTPSDIRHYRRFRNMILDARNMESIASNRYDAIFCNGVIEHIDDFHSAISEMTRVLCPGGILLINFPFNTQFHSIPIDYWRFTITAVHYLLDKDYIFKDCFLTLLFHKSFFRELSLLFHFLLFVL